MVATGHPSIDSTVDKTNRVLGDIENAYGWPRERRNQSYAALRAVLHALRDRLTVEQSAQLAAQLPTLIRGIYYEGWVPSRVPVKMGSHEFLGRVRAEFSFDVQGGVQPLTQAVLDALRRHVSEDEWDDIRSGMPQELASILA